MNIPEEPKAELRKTYRCPVPDGRQEAELRVGRRRIEVRLYNESSGGFAVWLEGDPGLRVGDRGQLYTDAGGFEVRIAHVGLADAIESDLLPDDERRAGTTLYRLGLERLADLEPRACRGSARDSLPCRHVPVQSHFGILLVAVAALLMIAATLGAVALMTHPHLPARLGLIQPPAPRQAPHRDLPNAGPDAAPLADVARQTGLTRASQERIERLAAQAASALREVDREWQGEGAEVRAARQTMILEAVAREVWRQLPPELQARRRVPGRPDPDVP